MANNRNTIAWEVFSIHQTDTDTMESSAELLLAKKYETSHYTVSINSIQKDGRMCHTITFVFIFKKSKFIMLRLNVCLFI